MYHLFIKIVQIFGGRNKRLCLFLLYTIYCAYREPQQRLGSDHDERFAEVSDHLPPQQVEVLGGGGGVHHCHVHVVTIHALLFTVAHLMNPRRQVHNSHQVTT